MKRLETNMLMFVFFRIGKDNKRIIYSVLEYSPLLDSSNMTTEDWGCIGKDIEVLQHYDCCVILVCSNSLFSEHNVSY